MQKAALGAACLRASSRARGAALRRVGAAYPTTAYRVRAKLVWGEDGSLGLFARDSHAVVDIPECRVLAPPLLRVAAAARSQLRGVRVTLDGLDLRLVDRGVLVTLIARRGTARRARRSSARAVRRERRSRGGRRELPRGRRGHGARHGARGARGQRRGAASPPRGPGPITWRRTARSSKRIWARPGAPTDAIERALRQLSARKVLELYAGSAALSLGLAAAGFELTAVEAFAPALAQAERAAREQKLALRTVSGQAERVTRELAARAAHFDAVIVNPPRRGLSVDVRIAIAVLAPQALLYMSCEPATFARDLAHLRELGFDAQELWPFDMIPHSAAVECLVVARRSACPAPRVVHRRRRADRRSTNRATMRRNRCSTACRALARGERGQLPLHELDADHSGLVLFARSAANLPALQAALAAGARTCVGLSRGVTHKKGRIRRPLRGKPRGAPPCTRVSAHGRARGTRLAAHRSRRLCTNSPAFCRDRPSHLGRRTLRRRRVEHLFRAPTRARSQLPALRRAAARAARRRC